MIKAVIFDMDGTMVDTENLWQDVNHKLAKLYGVKMDDTIRAQMMGKNDKGSLGAFKKYFHLPTPLDEIKAVRRKMIVHDISKVKTTTGLFELLDLLEKQEIKKAVATSAFREFADKILDKFQLKNRFTTIVTADDVKEGKPHPDIFLEAAKRLQVDSENVLVIEDAQNGVEAAYNAKMKVIAIPHEYSINHDFSKATMVVKSFEEITQELLTSL